TTNLLMFLVIFLCQVGIGWVVDLWPAHNGVYPPQAHLVAWGIMLALQAGAAVGYFWPDKARRAARLDPAEEKVGPSGSSRRRGHGGRAAARRGGGGDQFLTYVQGCPQQLR